MTRFSVGVALHYAALATALTIYLHCVRADKLSLKAGAVSAMLAAASALAGGRLLAIIFDGFDASGMISWGVYGGAALSTLVALQVMGQRGHVLSFLDAAAPGFAAAVVIARLGCFIAGCCYGKISWEPWGMRFARGTAVFDSQVSLGLISATAPYSIPVFPVQLLLAAVGVICLSAVLVVRRAQIRTPGPGLAVSTCMMAYCAGRSLVEPLRGDGVAVRGLPDPGLTFSYLGTAVGACLTGWLLWKTLQRNPPETKLS